MLVVQVEGRAEVLQAGIVERVLVCRLESIGCRCHCGLAVQLRRHVHLKSGAGRRVVLGQPSLRVSVKGRHRRTEPGLT